MSEECIETSDIVFNKCWSFTVASVTFNYEGEKKKKLQHPWNFVQAIKMLCNDPRNKKIFLQEKNMIPNIKSSEGMETVSWKVIHAGSESIMFSVLQETQYVYR
jgi:hypothetical protein